MIKKKKRKKGGKKEITLNVMKNSFHSLPIVP